MPRKDDIRSTLEKLNNGDSIMSSELEELRDHLKSSIAHIAAMHYEPYSLVLFDMRWKLERIEGYLRARKERF